MPNIKLDAVRELIREKHYDAARTVLQTMNDSTAAEWFAKLDNRFPAQKPQQRRSLLPWIITLLSLMIAAASIVFVVLPRLSNQNEDEALIRNAVSLSILLRVHTHSVTRICHHLR